MPRTLAPAAGVWRGRASPVGPGWHRSPPTRRQKPPPPGSAHGRVALQLVFGTSGDTLAVTPGRRMCHPRRLFCHPHCGCSPSIRVHQSIDAGGDAGDLRYDKTTQLHELCQASLHRALGAADVLGEGGHGWPGAALMVGVGGDGDGHRSLVLPKVSRGEQGSLDGLTHVYGSPSVRVRGACRGASDRSLG
jgi:hypothetical protein